MPDWQNRTTLDITLYAWRNPQGQAKERQTIIDPTIFEVQLLDDQGLTSRSSIYVAYNGTTTTTESLIGSWSQWGALIEACTDCQIVQGRITIPLLPNAAWKDAPLEGSNANQVMSLNFKNDFNRYLTALLIPGYKEILLTPDNKPDLADPGLVALIDFMIDGDVDLFPNSRDLHDLNALKDAFLTTRRVRNQTRIVRTKAAATP